MLNADQRDKLREQLKAEKARLLRNAQEGLTFSMDRDRDKVGRDSIDESVEEEMFSTQLRLRDREKFLLGKIDSALERLESNTIDECEDCGEPIGYKRLLARPVTTMCIACKEDREREERSEAMTRGGDTGLVGGGGGDDEPVAVPED
jgi:DnaK suppressor protein